MAIKESKEFNKRIALIKLQEGNDIKKHELVMEELKYRRESEDIKHEKELARGRIKSAEIRRMQERKEFSDINKRHG